MTIFLAILNAISAIPKIAGYVEQFAAAVVGWYVSRQKAATLSAIADAAALSAHAQTDEDRYNAAAAWQKALSSPRITNS